jgi:predicted glycosyltransferase
MTMSTAMSKVWIDVDNPPQVQYLIPFVQAFRSRGMRVVVTARDYGSAVELLRQRGITFQVVGAEFGRSKLAKTWGVINRARELRSLVGVQRTADLLLCSSRSSALAARVMRIPSFVIADYEYANFSFFRLTGSTIFYPDVVDPTPLLTAGIRADRLVPFRGLKEDISFGGLDLNKVVPHHFSDAPDDELIKVLFRPPAENSHYYEKASGELALRTLEHLAAQREAVVVFSPRHPRQTADLRRFRWHNHPIVLDRAVPFLSLLKGVDVVVCSGGTMLREAAYLGIPAYSIFKSRLGAVDLFLASLGRAHLIATSDDLSAIELKKAPPLLPLLSNPGLRDELVRVVLDKSCKGARRRGDGPVS